MMRRCRSSTVVGTTTLLLAVPSAAFGTLFSKVGQDKKAAEREQVALDACTSCHKKLGHTFDTCKAWKKKHGSKDK